jgi:hypothetical protein
MIDKGAKK